MNDGTHEQARLLVDTVKMLRNHFVAKQEMGGRFTESQLGTLLALRDEGEVSLKQLARTLRVSSPSASTMVDRLVEGGFARREASTVDRREIRVGLTEAGRAAVSEYEEAFLTTAAELLRRVGPECAEQWCSVYRRVQDVLKADRVSTHEPALVEGE